MTEGGLCALNKCGADITDTESGLVGIDDMVVDDRGDMHVDIIFGHTYLRWHFNDGDFDIDLL